MYYSFGNNYLITHNNKTTILKVNIYTFIFNVGNFSRGTGIDYIILLAVDKVRRREVKIHEVLIPLKFCTLVLQILLTIVVAFTKVNKI